MSCNGNCSCSSKKTIFGKVSDVIGEIIGGFTNYDKNINLLYSKFKELSRYTNDLATHMEEACGPKKVRIYRICKDNPLPTQANPKDAGWDVYSSEDTVFKFGETKLVPLGIIAEAPEGFHFKLCLRSSMALKRGFRLSNGVGIVDHSYAGEKDEMKAILTSWNDEDVVIKKGERIGQLLLERNYDIEWVEQVDSKFRGKSRGGFGSSDSGKCKCKSG